ncbi:growth arrest-specific protein 7-like [Styela clava]
MSQTVCEALYPFKGTEGQPSPLIFESGEIISVIKKHVNGWWEGEKEDGQRGWFPAAYVREKPLPSPPPPEESPPSPPPPGPLPPGWREAKTPDGRTYYYFKKTKETTWVRPAARYSGEKDKSIKSPNSIRVYNGQRTHSRGLSDASSPGNSPPTSPGPVKKENTEEKPVCYVVNGVCLPDAKRAKEQELLQPGRYSYCDYFWRDKGDKHVYESGFSVILAKQQKGKHLCKEMSELFKAREALEMQYSKGLALLSSEIYAATEEGTLSEAWKQVKGSLLQESKIHKDFATKLRTEIEKPLAEYKDDGKKENKRMETSMNEFRKQLTHRHQAVEREKITMNERQKDLEMKLQSPKKDEDVIKAKRKSTKQREDLGQAISLYNTAKDHWFEEMVTSTLVLEKKEVERINLVKTQLDNYVKLLQDVSSKTKKTSENVKQKTEAVDPAKDRELWVKQNKTGTVRPIDMVKR